MTRFTLLTLVTSATLLLPGTAAGQGKPFPLESVEGLRLHNVTAEPATLQGKKGLRLTLAADAARRLGGMQPGDLEQLAGRGRLFSNGVIEAEIAGAPAPGASEAARGFVGVAFRLQEDRKTYDAFYCRPRTDVPRIRNGATIRFDTSLIPNGRGSGFARRRRPSTKRMSISYRQPGPRSRSRCVTNVRASTCTTTNSRR